MKLIWHVPIIIGIGKKQVCMGTMGPQYEDQIYMCAGQKQNIWYAYGINYHWRDCDGHYIKNGDIVEEKLEWVMQYHIQEGPPMDWREISVLEFLIRTGRSFKETIKELF